MLQRANHRTNKQFTLPLNMPMKVAALNSGSNGNCYWFGAGEEAILVDAGLSCKEMEKRMDRMGIRMDQVRALLITHEHSDHVFGIRGLMKKYDIELYVTRSTWMAAGISLDKGRIIHFTSPGRLAIGGFEVRPFRTRHDAADPHGFLVSHCGTTAGVFTDIGVACPRVKKHFAECHLAFLECNYEEEMLENGPYPRILKDRIRGGLGHLSNRQAMELLRDHRHPGLKHAFLAHMSKENNSPEQALKWFDGFSARLSIEVAGRYGETRVVEVTSGTGDQLSLF